MRAGIWARVWRPLAGFSRTGYALGVPRSSPWAGCGLPRFLNECDCGSGAHGEPRPWEEGGGEGMSPVEAEAMRRHTAQAMRAHVRGRGDLPAGWRRWAEEVLEPVVDWRTVLAGGPWPPASVRRS
ncbi:hypothetical protein HNP84_008069 [Thermocatellispora tengchongensis]|uniref:Putative metallopeptidase domain-containing protein n=1 Tax=Thermocatellispora tengchongensis TaxID=1073253 RepID=A0A840PHK0_9ACTN|nr:hypothetical protein [Thermocatellispora tengchongensis]MBB5138316.1 hypothetical protein [Thermocatellispora tengchongensis]